MVHDFTYVGITRALSKEVHTYGTWSTKTYAYDVFGSRATISDKIGSTTNRYSYLYDPHGSVSLLIDQSNTVKESYGYEAYGSSNAAISRTASGFNNKTNPYRYTGKRLDSGSGTYDMGARRYSASTTRFLQYDLYYNALDNLGLSEDPLTQNRYAFAGGNPVNFVEVDGHSVVSLVVNVLKEGARGAKKAGQVVYRLTPKNSKDLLKAFEIFETTILGVGLLATSSTFGYACIVGSVGAGAVACTLITIEFAAMGLLFLGTAQALARQYAREHLSSGSDENTCDKPVLAYKDPCEGQARGPSQANSTATSTKPKPKSKPKPKATPSPPRRGGGSRTWLAL